MNQLSLFSPLKKNDKVVKPVPTTDLQLSKSYYNIKEVAAMFNANASLLRFWEKEFPTQLGKLKKNKKGDRFYNQADIEKLKVLFYLTKEKKMTLEGARNYLKNDKKKVSDEYELIEQLKEIKFFLQNIKKSLK